MDTKRTHTHLYNSVKLFCVKVGEVGGAALPEDAGLDGRGGSGAKSAGGDAAMVSFSRGARVAWGIMVWLGRPPATPLSPGGMEMGRWWGWCVTCADAGCENDGGGC